MEIDHSLAYVASVNLGPSYLTSVNNQVLREKSKSMTGVEQWPYRAVADALEVIPRTLIQNCGASTIRTITALRVRLFFTVWYLKPFSGKTLILVISIAASRLGYKSSGRV